MRILQIFLFTTSAAVIALLITLYPLLETRKNEVSQNLERLSESDSIRWLNIQNDATRWRLYFVEALSTQESIVRLFQSTGEPLEQGHNNQVLADALVTLSEDLDVPYGKVLIYDTSLTPIAQMGESEHPDALIAELAAAALRAATIKDTLFLGNGVLYSTTSIPIIQGNDLVVGVLQLVTPADSALLLSQYEGQIDEISLFSNIYRVVQSTPSERIPESVRSQINEILTLLSARSETSGYAILESENYLYGVHVLPVPETDISQLRWVFVTSSEHEVTGLAGLYRLVTGPDRIPHNILLVIVGFGLSWILLGLLLGRIESDAMEQKRKKFELLHSSQQKRKTVFEPSPDRSVSKAVSDEDNFTRDLNFSSFSSNRYTPPLSNAVSHHDSLPPVDEINTASPGNRSDAIELPDANKMGGGSMQIERTGAHRNSNLVTAATPNLSSSGNPTPVQPPEPAHENDVSSQFTSFLGPEPEGKPNLSDPLAFLDESQISDKFTPLPADKSDDVDWIDRLDVFDSERSEENRSLPATSSTERNFDENDSSMSNEISDLMLGEGIPLSRSKDINENTAVLIPDDGDQETVIHSMMPSNLSQRPKDYYSLLYTEYTSLKQQLGQSNQVIPIDNFVEKVKEKEDSIKKRHKCKQVTVEVFVKNGRVGIRAKPEQST